MEELERTPAPRPNPHRRPAAGARAGEAATGRGVRLREGRTPFPVCNRMKGLWALSVTRPIGPLWEPNALDGANRLVRGVKQTSPIWLNWAEPNGPLSAQWHFQPIFGPRSMGR
jgi:hypothetical protein